MANITEYFAPPGTVPEPTERASTTAREAGFVKNRFAREAGEALGGAIKHVGGQIGAEIDDHIASQQISHGAAISSQAFADLHQTWNTIREKSDPNDTSVAAGFNEKIFQPWAEHFLKQFESSSRKAQDWAQRRVEDMRGEFFRTVTADMGVRAADAAHQNIVTSAKADSLAAFNSPSSLGFLYDQAAANAQAQLDANPYLTAQQRKEIHNQLVPAHQKEIAWSAIMGMGRLNPESLLQKVESGEFDKYLDAPMRERALIFARERIRDMRVDKEYQYHQQKRTEDETAKLAKNDYVTQILNGTKLGDYANDPKLMKYPEDKENIRSLLHAVATQKDNTPHPANWRNLMAQLHDTFERDPNNISDKPIWGALNAGKINRTEFASALSIFHGIDGPLEKTITLSMKRVEIFAEKSFEGQALKMIDPSGYVDALNRFELDRREKLRNATDKNPLLDPKSKDYLFNLDDFKTFLPPLKKTIGDGANATQAGEIIHTKQGDFRYKGAGDRNLQSSYEPVAATTQAPPAKIIPMTSGIPRTFEAFETAQEALRPAVEAKGWKWEPDKWNYSVGNDGQLERTLSAGRAAIKVNYAKIVAEADRKARDKANE
jgi:hypothetical protein